MNILLYDTGSNRNELNEPYGIESIAGSLLNCEEDFNIDFRWELLEPIEFNNLEKNYDLIGISAKLGTLNILEKLLTYFCSHRKQRRLIVGGPLATFGYQSLLAKYEDLICVRGEGESTFIEICKEYIKGDFNIASFSKIPNLAFNQENKIFETIRKVEILSTIPPPFRYYLNDIVKNKGIIRIENSRGCSWSNCSFCSVSEHYGTKCWRPFPIDFVIQQMIELSKKGCLSPYFTDEDFFGSDYERSTSLAEAIIEEKKKGSINPKMNFFFSARINDIINYKGLNAIKIWKKAGLREIFIGLESGVHKQLKRYGKPASPNRNAKVIKIINDLQIQLDIGYILFDPEMNFDELVENLNYIKNEKLSQHDSRSLKKIRAQPFTITTSNYTKKGLINGELNLNLLYYPLNYSDVRVFQIMTLYDKWEEKLSNEVYLLQSNSRGEVVSEEYRIYLKGELSKIRELDFEILLKIVDYVLNIVDYSNFINFNKEILDRKKAILKNIE